MVRVAGQCSAPVVFPSTPGDTGRMRRYEPTDEERLRVAALERANGIRPGGPDDTGGAAEGTVERRSIAQWRNLWRDDRGAWIAALRDRPRRYDPERWRRAVVTWEPGTPSRDEPADRPMYGVPIVVKDLFDVRGERTRCGARLLYETLAPEPATTDSWLVARLRAAGAVPVGRTGMNEFAYGLDGRNSYLGDCPHPLDPRRLSGGSSSGSAWAVAAGVVPLALGTDTGGSIRLPAALCGVYGVRFTQRSERVAGVFPLSRRMDTVGLFAAGTSDLRTAMGEVLSLAARDDRRERETIVALIPPGVSLTPDVEERWRAAVAALASAVPEYRILWSEAPEEFGDPAYHAYNVIGSRDAWDIHKPWMDRYADWYDPIVHRLIDRGRQWTDERIATAEAAQAAVVGAFDRLFANAALVAMPVTPVASPTVDEANGAFRETVLRIMGPASLAGLPAVTVPLHHDAVRSSGVQFIAPRDHENRLDRVLAAWESVVS